MNFPEGISIANLDFDEGTEKNTMIGFEGSFSIWFLVIGIIAGWLAGRLTHGHGFGLFGDLAVGIIGAFVGGYLFSLLGLHTYDTIGAIIMATIGATVFLGFLNLIF